MKNGVFAYRLPEKNEYLIFKGNFFLTDKIVVPDSNQIILVTFDKKQILVFTIEQSISFKELEDFNFFISEIQTETDIEIYSTNFQKCLSLLKAKSLDKIVLSRIKNASTDKNPAVIFQHLNENYSNTFNYLFSSELTGTWLGATPELLLRTQKFNISSVSLAGTKVESAEWTEKEILEQKIVTDFIIDCFEKVGIKNIHDSEVYTIQAGNIQHLKSDIKGVFHANKELIELLNLLHPTPATSGFPQQKASELIMHIEKHQRNFYTGFLGVNMNGDFHFFVNLRCMQIMKEIAQLYVGGGLLVDSVLENEWQETERKAQTLEKILSA